VQQAAGGIEQLATGENDRPSLGPISDLATAMRRGCRKYATKRKNTCVLAVRSLALSLAVDGVED
jgi:hypothetical protein